MEKISVFLDDYRRAPDGHVLVETIDDCILLLQTYEIDHLSLDHDLVSKSRNGLMLVHIMVQEQLFADRITVHSANSVGGKAMYRYLKQAQLDFEMPTDIKVLLRPLPLNYIPPNYLHNY
ncbi:hypothetical protein E4O93_19835 [Diaphorobacter sp. DS2]|nr:hypothetical protein E4O93_19835 [Diaphorobacter sp. DS2]